MSNRRHLYIPDDLWHRLTSEAGTVGVRERHKAYSASEYACKLLAGAMDAARHKWEWEWDEQSTRADAQPTGQGGSAAESYAREYFRWCPRERCRAQGREEHGGYCSANHRLADEQERNR